MKCSSVGSTFAHALAGSACALAYASGRAARTLHWSLCDITRTLRDLGVRWLAAHHESGGKNEHGEKRCAFHG